MKRRIHMKRYADDGSGRNRNIVDKYASSRRSRGLNDDLGNRSTFTSDRKRNNTYEPTQYELPEDYSYGDEASGDEYFDKAGSENEYDDEGYDYGDEDYLPPYGQPDRMPTFRGDSTNVPPYGQKDRSYKQKRNMPPYGQPDKMPTFRGDSTNVPPYERKDRSYKQKRNGGDDLASYMDYIERYDNGEIDNHDMSRVQRRFENSPFWETFNPSEKMIREYGSGNESTKWPLFEYKDGRWRPMHWRND